MDEPLYQKYLNKLEFTGVSRFRIWTTEYDENDTSSHDWISEDRFPYFIPHIFPPVFKERVTERKRAPGFTFIGGRGNGTPSQLSTTSSFLEEIIETCHLPRVFAQTLLANNGSLASFVEHEEVDHDRIPAYLSVILKAPYAPMQNISCAMRLDLRQNTAVCLFFDPDEAALNTLMARMKVRQQQLVQDPLSFIGLLFEGYGYATEEWRGALDEDVVKTESQTRMSSLNFVVASQIAAKHYETLTRDLHSCNTDLIFLDTMLAFELKFGEFCKKTTEKADRLRRLVTQAPLCNNLDEFNDNMDYLYNLCELRRNQTQSLRNRIQSQINVLYSLISQRDSKISLLVAEESKKITTATMMDSKAMRTIAVLTLVFLPGTFVAAIFSTGVFDLRSAAESRAVDVAPMWWVFVSATIILTLIVLSVWLVFHRVHAKRKDTLDKLEKAE